MSANSTHLKKQAGLAAAAKEMCVQNLWHWDSMDSSRRAIMMKRCEKIINAYQQAYQDGESK